ncbi:hypothetical protein WJX81_000649 [Elliptochloris bilobata]|uniref:Uncharacterized protein n=1 Tax=Elliptochloris bilobata TaxID=381761 RepID=A0AAW1R0K5_9CHLO
MDIVGQPHLVNLLQHAGFVREVVAASKPLCISESVTDEVGKAPRRSAVSPAEAQSRHGDPATGAAAMSAPVQPRASLLGRSSKVSAALRQPQCDEAVAETAAGGGSVAAAAATVAADEGATSSRAELPPVARGVTEQRLAGLLRLPFVRVDLEDGLLAVIEEFGQVFGGSVRLEVRAGSAQVRELARANGIDCGWLARDRWPAASEQTGAPRFPVAVKVEADNLSARFGGWRTSTGVLLRQPLAATINFTPALAKYGLQRLHPLLAHAMALQRGSSVIATVQPLAGHLPAEGYTVRMQPLKLRMHGHPIVRGALRLLEFRGRGAKRGGLECWTSAVEAEVWRTGELVSKRMDVLVSRDFRVSKAPLHLAMWGHGRLDASVGSVVDATVAVPAYTLAMAGLPSLPEEYMLQLRARGAADNPTIDWLKGTRILAGLVVKCNLPTLGIKRLQRWMDKRIEHKVEKCGPVPPPTLPLPWEAWLHMPKRQLGSRKRASPLDAPVGAPMSTGDAAAAAVAAADAREAAERERDARAAAGADPTDATPPEPPPVNAHELHHGPTWRARAAALKASCSGVMTAALAAELFKRACKEGGDAAPDDTSSGTSSGTSDDDDGRDSDGGSSRRSAEDMARVSRRSSRS